MHLSTRVLEAQLDWLTMAVHSTDKAITWWDIAVRLAERERQSGNQRQPFELGGYNGWRCGRVRYGRRQAATLIQLSGDLASSSFDRLWRDHDTATRIDLAVTVRTLTYDGSIASEAYRQAQAFRSAHPASAQASLVQDSDDGSTCYVGRRSSDRYLRIYNKESESRSAGDLESTQRYACAWRYELELKGVAAHAIGQALAVSKDRAAWIVYYLHWHCLQHGITPIFAPGPLQLLPQGFRRRSDRDSRLAWLESTVAPTVKWLLDTTDAEEVRSILGLGLIGHEQPDPADDNPPGEI